MVEKAMKSGDNSKMIKGIKGLSIKDLNIPSTNITLKPNDEICALVTINITVAGKSFIGGNMQITVVALLEMCGKISKSPDGFVVIKVVLCKVTVKSCKTNLPSSML
ncbi:hypothetical protein F3A57_24070, partial [Salmonella enterica subsp. enterica serovar Typhi]|nr:hypothetical protein [Salmonella enterica subsp. enterica serovar Typhi]